MPKIFISYRREDSQWPVDRIHAALKPHVADPKADIFVDVDNIPVGVDWVAYLDSKVAQCDVLLAVIGPDWLNIQNPKTGKRRLDDPKDFVRIEIASALKRGVAVAPVLLDGVELPEPEDLPEDIRPLLGRQGVEVSRMNFDADVQRLITGLGLGKPQAPAAATSTRRPEPKGSPAPMISLVLLVLAGGGVAVYGYKQGWFGRPAEASNRAGSETGAATPDSAETAAWVVADGLKSADAYGSYLASYPGGAHAKEANDALAVIADDADWTKAAGRGRTELNDYLAAHPAGAHIEEARRSLAELDKAERDVATPETHPATAATKQTSGVDPCVKSRADWAQISNSSSEDVIRTFIAETPDSCGVQRSQAQDRLTAIKTAAAQVQAQAEEAERARAQFASSPAGIEQRVRALGFVDGRYDDDNFSPCTGFMNSHPIFRVHGNILSLEFQRQGRTEENTIFEVGSDYFKAGTSSRVADTYRILGSGFTTTNFNGKYRETWKRCQ